MKKKTAAISHINNDPGPNFAVVPRCLRPRTATRLKRTRSRSLSPRTRCGGLVVCVTLEDGRAEMGDGKQTRRRSEIRGQRSVRKTLQRGKSQDRGHQAKGGVRNTEHRTPNGAERVRNFMT